MGACLKHTPGCLSHHIEIVHRPGKRFVCCLCDNEGSYAKGGRGGGGTSAGEGTVTDVCCMWTCLYVNRVCVCVYCGTYVVACMRVYVWGVR